MKKGSITFYLCLILLLMLSLLFAGFASARQACGRVVLCSACEQSLYSLFAGYDRTLFEKYGLFFLEAGYGSSDLQMGKMLRQVREDAAYITEPGRGSLPIGKDICGIQLQKEACSLTGYVTATDLDGAAFCRQVCQTMTDQLGLSAISLLWDHVAADSEEGENVKAERGGINQSTEEASYQAHEKAEKPDPVKENPADKIAQEKKKGLLALALPKDREVSEAEIDLSDLPGGRNLSPGVGMMPTGWEGGSKLLLLEYLTESFPCFLDQDKEKGLQYQVEYAIIGKASDKLNLQRVLKKILVLREAANMVCLMASESKREAVETLADGICASMLTPEAAPVVAFGIELAWAYGESILDLQDLLEGEKVPIHKTDEDWQLSLEHLGELTTRGSQERHGSAFGLDYRDYLRILLLAKEEGDVKRAMMDLVEHNMRTTEGKMKFRLDHCIDALQIELGARIGNVSYRCERSYGYDIN